MHSVVNQSYIELHLQSLVLSLPPVNEDSVVVLDEVDKLPTESDLDNMTQRVVSLGGVPVQDGGEEGDSTRWRLRSVRFCMCRVRVLP